MRRGLAILVVLVLMASDIRSEEKKPAEAASVRYGVAVDLKTYPQATAKEAFASVLKAIEEKKIAYLLAQLTDPVFVDERVKHLFAGKFDSQVAETRSKLDAGAIKQLTKFQEKGEWTEEDSRAIVRLKDAPERLVAFKKIGARWYLENQNRPERPAKEK